MNGELDFERWEAYLQNKRRNNAPRIGAAATYAATSFATLGLLEIPNPRDSFLKRPQENDQFTFQPEQANDTPERFDIRDHMKDIHELGKRAVTTTRFDDRVLTGYASERA